MNQLDLVLCDRPVRGSTTKQRLKIARCASTQFQKSFAASENKCENHVKMNGKYNNIITKE